jgi:hypothetical protein
VLVRWQFVGYVYELASLRDLFHRGARSKSVFPRNVISATSSDSNLWPHHDRLK